MLYYFLVGYIIIVGSVFVVVGLKYKEWKLILIGLLILFFSVY